MKNYYKFFYIFVIVSFIILLLKETMVYLKKEQAQRQFLILQSKTFISFINAFRNVYQNNFIKYHIDINKKTIHLIPVTTLPKILQNFSERIDGDLKVRLVSDRPRNPKNMANKKEIKIINYFKSHKKNEYIYKNKNKNEFIYYQPLYIKKTCLKCHTTKKKAPKFIREHYNNAYGYKIGDIRGIISIKIKNSKFLNIVNENFYNRMYIDFILYLITLVIVFLLIKAIEKLNKKHTKEFLEINKKLKIEKQKADDNTKSKSEFLANMSHEIRTPLNAMIGFIKLLEDKDLDKESKEYLNIVEKSGGILLNVINDILDVSKIESGKLEIEHISFNPKEEIELIYNLFESKANEKGVNLYIKEHNLDYNIISDPIRIKQIISNLLSNAIKFTSQNKNIYLTIKYNSHKEELFVEVKDEGIGISEEKLESIFKPFSQEDSSITRKYGGTGLGLTISYQLVKLLGGELKLTSKKNEGSIFYFRIPVKESNKKLENKIESKNDKFNYNILIVEDNKANQMFLGVVLKKFGIQFDIANDGIEALEKYIENYKKYDLILMDENMPNMSGSEATIKIREFENEHNLENIFIVATTANALSGDKERFLKIGMNDYISKPIDIEKLKNIFRRFDEYNYNRSK